MHLMLKSFLLLIAAVAFVPPVLANELTLGAPVQEVNAKLLDSPLKFSLSANKGKVIIINFWATWCAPCLKEMPDIQAFYQTHHGSGLEVLAINMDDLKDLQKVRLIAKNHTFPIAHKSESNFKSLGRIWRLPSTFVVDKNGLLRKDGGSGDPEISFELLDSLVTPLLNAP